MSTEDQIILESLVDTRCDVILEKNLNGQQPDFNDFDAVLNFVSRMDSIKNLRYHNYSYVIDQKDPIEVSPGIYFRLEGYYDKDDLGSVKKDVPSRQVLRLWSDNLNITKIKEFIVNCRQDFENQRNNKLGDDLYFFDQTISSESRYLDALTFDKKKFVTHRTFNNVFFEEKDEVQNRVKHFLEDKEWYVKRGIPYTLGFLFHGDPGVGKCLARDTPIRMFNGSIKMVQDIIVGDQLLGDDGTVRNVLSVTSGTDMMYRITQKYGASYDVNSVHILSLLKDGQPVDISIVDFMKQIFTEQEKYTRYPCQQLNSFNGQSVTDRQTIWNYWLSNATQTDNVYSLNDAYNIAEIAQSLGITAFAISSTDIIVPSDPNTISVTQLTEDTYYGFTLDGNARFVLGDFTVTHNTSTIKAIANVAKRHIINVRLSEIKTNTQLKNLFYNPVLQVKNPETSYIEKYIVPINQRFYIIEDIDCMTNIVKRRDLQPSQPNAATSASGNGNGNGKKQPPLGAKKNSVTVNLDSDDGDAILDQYLADATIEEEKDMLMEQIDEKDKITLDSLLNILDGTLEIPGRMFCITTNYYDELDPALIRPGRVDMTIKFKYCNHQIIKQMVDSFYEQSFPLETFLEIKPYKISPAVVNQVLFKYFKTPEKAIAELIALGKQRKPYETKKEKSVKVNE